MRQAARCSVRPGSRITDGGDLITARRTTDDEPKINAAGAGHAGRRERIREGMTMALYVSLSLLAVMVALPPEVTRAESSPPARVVFFTAIGLLVAHQLAFRISTRLVHHGELTSQNLELLAAQLIGGGAVTAIAVVPVLLFESPTGVLIAELLLVAFVALVGYAAARTVPVSRARAIVYMTSVVVLTGAVIWIKNLVAH